MRGLLQAMDVRLEYNKVGQLSQQYIVIMKYRNVDGIMWWHTNCQHSNSQLG